MQILGPDRLGESWLGNTFGYAVRCKAKWEKSSKLRGNGCCFYERRIITSFRVMIVNRNNERK